MNPYSMATHIHFIGGEKGGVGKSLMARVLAQYMIDKEIPFIGFDTDRSHGALMRFYSGYASPVVMDRYEALDVIVEAAAEQPERRILVEQPDARVRRHDAGRDRARGLRRRVRDCRPDGACARRRARSAPR